MWDAATYLQFADERARPFADLLSQVRAESPSIVADLGCGTGHLTQALAHRWPSARVLGIDNSPEMLAKAYPLSQPGRLEFELASIADWARRRPVDVIVSNAALQWLPDHATLLRRLVAMLAPGGTLAVQMPTRFGTPSQLAVEETVADARWQARLSDIGLHRDSVQPLEWYAQQLQKFSLAVNAWQTTYLHVMSGTDPVLEWLSGTALRPLLAKLDVVEAREFCNALAKRLRGAYPCHEGRTLFAMPRLFFVATRT